MLYIIGHRGDGSGPDENTLASCRRAISHGADAVEVDVRITDDGALVTGHDPGDEAAALTDILDGTDIPLWLHIKEAPWNLRRRPRFSPTYYQQVIDAVAPLISRKDATFLSFSAGAIRYCQERYPDVPTALSTFRLSRALKRPLVKPDILCAYPRLITSRIARVANEKRIPLGTINTSYSTSTHQRYKSLGVRYLITDDVSSWNHTRVTR